MLMRFDPFREFDRLADQVFGGRSAMAVDAYRQGDGARLRQRRKDSD
jgi:hypothetical protein